MRPDAYPATWPPAVAAPVCDRCGATKVWRRDPRRPAGGGWRCPTRSHKPGKPQEQVAHVPEAPPAETGPRLIRTGRLRRDVRPVAMISRAGRAEYLYWEGSLNGEPRFTGPETGALESRRVAAHMAASFA